MGGGGWDSKKFKEEREVYFCKYQLCSFSV